VNHDKILILGIGNVLMGDEGVGVHAIKYLQEKKWPRYVVFLDGGTGGFQLLSEMAKYRKVVMIDATLSTDPPGTVSLLKPRFSYDFPPSLGAHDIGLKDLIDALQITEQMPELFLVTVSVNSFAVMGTELTPNVSKSMKIIFKKVRELIMLL